jgi:hypothetical protein
MTNSSHDLTFDSVDPPLDISTPRTCIVHVIPQVSKIKAYIFNYKIHMHEIMLCIIFYNDNDI